MTMKTTNRKNAGVVLLALGVVLVIGALLFTFAGVVVGFFSRTRGLVMLPATQFVIGAIMAVAGLVLVVRQRG
jgi:hypothetical protein